MRGKKVTGCYNEECCNKKATGTVTRGWDDTKGRNDKMTGEEFKGGDGKEGGNIGEAGGDIVIRKKIGVDDWKV